MVRWGLRGEVLGEGLDVGTNRTIDVTDLEPGTEYEFHVVAVNSIGEGPMSKVVSVPLGLPCPIDDLEVSSADGSLDLEWSVPDDGGSTIIHFLIRRGTSAGELTNLTNVSAGASSYRDEGLQNGIEYWYQVVAVSDLGDGQRGTSMSAVPVGPPSPPTGLNITCGDGWLLLEWVAPAEDGGSSLTGYAVLRGDSPSNLSERARGIERVSFNDTEVVNGVTYYYTVVAINKAWEGLPSDCESATPGPSVTRPSPPRELSATAKGRTVELAWSEPALDGGSPIIGYVILRGISEDDLEVVGETGPEHSYNDVGLRRGTRYYYRVISKNGLYESDPSEVVEAKVPKQQSDSPDLIAPLALIAITVVAMAMRHRQGYRFRQQR
jgi:titin